MQPRKHQQPCYILGHWQQVLHNGIPPPNPPPTLEVKPSGRGLQVISTWGGPPHCASVESFDMYGFRLRWHRCLHDYSLPGGTSKHRKSTLIETTLIGRREKHIGADHGGDLQPLVALCCFSRRTMTVANWRELSMMAADALHALRDVRRAMPEPNGSLSLPWARPDRLGDCWKELARRTWAGQEVEMIITVTAATRQVPLHSNSNRYG